MVYLDSWCKADDERPYRGVYHIESGETAKIGRSIFRSFFTATVYHNGEKWYF